MNKLFVKFDTCMQFETGLSKMHFPIIVSTEVLAGAL